jgi:hypothetical protein
MYSQARVEWGPAFERALTLELVWSQEAEVRWQAESRAEFGQEPATKTSSIAPQWQPKLPGISSRILLKAVLSSQLSALSNLRRDLFGDLPMPHRREIEIIRYG